MKKVFMRAHLSPFEVIPYHELHKRIGKNIGNLVFSGSMYRILMCDEETEIVYSNIPPNDQEEIERINNTFDCVVLPFADAIRKSFMKRMREWTQMIRMLRIPCCIAGIGIRWDYSGKRQADRELLKVPLNYPLSVSDPIYKNGKVKFFANAQPWINWLKTRDLSFGTRIHGNIAATLAGTPAVVLPFDARTRELCEYHGLAFVPREELNANDRLQDIVERLDFHSPEKVHSRNFKHFVDFLNKNGIDHIFKDGRSSAEEETAFDKRMKQIEWPESCECITCIDEKEAEERKKYARENNWFKSPFWHPYMACRGMYANL